MFSFHCLSGVWVVRYNAAYTPGSPSVSWFSNSSYFSPAWQAGVLGIYRYFPRTPRTPSKMNGATVIRVIRRFEGHSPQPPHAYHDIGGHRRMFPSPHGQGSSTISQSSCQTQENMRQSIGWAGKGTGTVGNMPKFSPGHRSYWAEQVIEQKQLLSILGWLILGLVQSPQA